MILLELYESSTINMEARETSFLVFFVPLFNQIHYIHILLQ